MTLAVEAPVAPPAPAPSAPPGRLASRAVRGTWVAFAVGLLAGALASAYTVAHGTNLDYGDAMAHLTIARRIVDSDDPGLAQLGTVWLPVPHLLLAPLTLVPGFYGSGLAGCVLGALCLGATCAALWRVLHRIGVPALAAVAALAVLLANPSVLYVHTTALTEPVLLTCLTATLAGLSGWAFHGRQLSGGELAVFAGIPAAAGVLTRYEAWPAALAGTVYVAIVARRRGLPWRRCATYAAAFAAPAAAAGVWWLAYNTATYGNPLEFLTGEYAASAFTEVFREKGQLTTEGNLGQSFAVLGWAMLETSGLGPLAVAGIGLLVLTWRRGLDDAALLVWLAAATTAFLLVSLWRGQHVMFNDASLPAGAYNNRYVLSAVPWVVLLVGVAAGEVARRGLVASYAVSAVVVAVLGCQCAWWAGDVGTRAVVVEEAQQQHAGYERPQAAARWLGEHYDGGGILMDQASGALLVAPVTDLSPRQFVTRSSGDAFDDAIADPAAHVRWVFMHRVASDAPDAIEVGGDQVTAGLLDLPQFHAQYRLVYAIDDLGIYRRVAP